MCIRDRAGIHPTLYLLVTGVAKGLLEEVMGVVEVVGVVEAQEVVVYRDTASEGLTAFKPLDLEAWWAGRIYKRLICG